MNLTEMFYGKFVPPQSMGTITHKAGFSGMPKYIPLKYPRGLDDNRSFEDKLSMAGKKVLSILRAQTKPITGEQMAAKTPFTRNYCSQIMSTFVKEGLAKRIKIKKPNTRLYAYTAVKKDD